MAHELIWSPASRYDLKELATYLAESDFVASRLFVQQLFSAVERLRTFPHSGRVVPEFGDPHLREVIKRPCRNVYRLKPRAREVEIVRVWHSAGGVPKG